jgi:hypothetical protein
MVTRISLQTALRNMQVDPIFERFIGCIVLGRMAEDVADTIDKTDLREVPSPLKHLVQLWQGRNRAPEAQVDVMALLQDTIKDMLP